MELMLNWEQVSMPKVAEAVRLLGFTKTRKATGTGREVTRHNRFWLLPLRTTRKHIEILLRMR